MKNFFFSPSNDGNKKNNKKYLLQKLHDIFSKKLHRELKGNQEKGY